MEGGAAASRRLRAVKRTLSIWVKAHRVRKPTVLQAPRRCSCFSSVAIRRLKGTCMVKSLAGEIGGRAHSMDFWNARWEMPAIYCVKTACQRMRALVPPFAVDREFRPSRCFEIQAFLAENAYYPAD